MKRRRATGRLGQDEAPISAEAADGIIARRRLIDSHDVGHWAVRLDGAVSNRRLLSPIV
jgi:hypothetical protein